MTRRHVVIVVCDGLGVGAAPDAAAYGDAGSDTLGHVLERCPTPLPNLERLGLLALLEPARGEEAAPAARCGSFPPGRTRRPGTGR